MTEILLIRHGQSANNALPEAQRISDPGLTPIGREQAERLSAYLQTAQPTHLYCSPFLRSLETGRPAAEAMQLQPHIRADIFEQGGCYSGYEHVGIQAEPGLGSDQLSQSYPGWKIDERIRPNGWWHQDYEGWHEAEKRAQRVAGWITNDLKEQGGRHALVIHADFKFLLIRKLLEKPSQPGSWNLETPLYNTGVSHFVWRDGGWCSLTVNSVDHLSAELTTF